MHLHPHICTSNIFSFIAYMTNVVAIFLFGIYLAIMCEVEIEVGFVLIYIIEKCWIYIPMWHVVV